MVKQCFFNRQNFFLKKKVKKPVTFFSPRQQFIVFKPNTFSIVETNFYNPYFPFVQ